MTRYDFFDEDGYGEARKSDDGDFVEYDDYALLETENAALRARIADLEAAQQWHPASEPPERGKDVCYSKNYLVYTTARLIFEAYYSYYENRWVNYNDSEDIDTAILYRDLPPMPEDCK